MTPHTPVYEYIGQRHQEQAFEQVRHDVAATFSAIEFNQIIEVDPILKRACKTAMYRAGDVRA